jgi:hypothetical protein
VIHSFNLPSSLVARQNSRVNLKQLPDTYNYPKDHRYHLPSETKNKQGELLAFFHARVLTRGQEM